MKNKLMAVLLAVVTFVSVLPVVSRAEAVTYDVWNYEGYTKYQYIYVRTTQDVYYYEETKIVPWYGKVAKGTLLGKIVYKMGSYRAPQKVDGMYWDGVAYDIEVQPKASIKAKGYVKNPDTGEFELGEGVTYTYYVASDFVNLKAKIPMIGTNTSANSAYEAQYQMYGGGEIQEYMPKEKKITSEGYSFSVGFPWAVSFDFSCSEDYCTVLDATNEKTGSWNVSFDYVIASYCNKNRRSILFENTEHAAALYWTTNDNSYRQPIQITAKFTLVDGKYFPTKLRTEKSVVTKYYTH